MDDVVIGFLELWVEENVKTVLTKVGRLKALVFSTLCYCKCLTRIVGTAQRRFDRASVHRSSHLFAT
jgi:hypothetical protein